MARKRSIGGIFGGAGASEGSGEQGASTAPTTSGTNAGAVGAFDITNPSWWIPSTHEIAIFVLAVFLTYWVIQIYQYNTVETKIIQESRCYKNKHAIKAGGVQYATATNAQNAPLYTVGYNLSGNQVSLECACKNGDIVNNFKNIPMYDFTNNSVTNTASKQCNCDTDLFSASPNVYFTGYPGIVKFMNTASVSKNVMNDQNIDTSYFLPTK
jgi:hypothetical protein